MTRRIVLIRHGESVANASRVFQGHGDSVLSQRGRTQAIDLGGRLQGGPARLVVSSDLERARSTAEIAGFSPETDATWRELDLGAWEGRSYEEIQSEFPEEIAALGQGQDVPVGGGESWSQVAERARGATAKLGDRLDDGQEALVFTHGGVIAMIVAGLLDRVGAAPPWPFDRVRNTSMTVIELSDRSTRLAVYNDFGHTDATEHGLNGSVVSIIRHGRTADNVIGAWSGRTDTPLDEVGIAEANAAAQRIKLEGPLVASPLRRAKGTAMAFREDFEIDPDLAEIDFGGWEGLTSAEVAEKFPDEWSRYLSGSDIAPGGLGERHHDVAARMWRAVNRLLETHQSAAAVSHGGAIRSLVASVVGLDHSARQVIGIPGNLRVTRLRRAEHGPVLMSYNAES